jgi:hypothetical protein
MTFLIRFCNDVEFGKSILSNTEDDEKEIKHRRQKLVKDQGYIGTLSKLLEACFPDELSLTFINHLDLNNLNGIKLPYNLLVT